MKVTKEQLKAYGEIYETFYENGYDGWLVDLGDYLMKAYKEITGTFIQARQDFITSDREVAAYAAWFMRYHNTELVKTHREAA